MLPVPVLSAISLEAAVTVIRLHVHAASANDTMTALALLDAELPASATPRMVFAFYGCGHDD